MRQLFQDQNACDGDCLQALHRKRMQRRHHPPEAGARHLYALCADCLVRACSRYSLKRLEPNPAQTAISNVKRFAKHISLSLGGVLLFGTPAAAQQEWQLDPVVVSANLTEQRLFDASASVSSVSIEPFQTASPLVNISELLIGTPGIQIRERQNYAQDLQLSIRGFGTRSTFGVRGCASWSTAFLQPCRMGKARRRPLPCLPRGV